MSNVIDRIKYSARRRPVRIIEALLALLVVLGVIDAASAEELLEQLVHLVGLLAVIGGLELAQKRTTPIADPRDAEGRSLVPSDDPHAAHHYEADAP